jgi:hypothetical protein
MADLFDVSIGGVGWHFTSHLIALAALFIACFAIAGYITFRDDSVPDSALHHGGDNKFDFDENVQMAKDLTVAGQIDHGATGFREKVYSADYTTLGAISVSGNSIGAIATGFGAGHFVTFTTVEIRTGEELAGNAGAVVFEIDTAANAAFDGTPAAAGSAITGAAALVATNTASAAAASPTTANGFTTTNNTLCITLVTEGQSAIGATSHIRVTAKVTAMPNSPPLP